VQGRGNDFDSTRFPESVVQRLLGRGYLAELSKTQERDSLLRIVGAIHEQELAHHRTVFIVVPTYQCNLRCPYCFQSHKMHAGLGEFSSIMSIDQANDVFATIDRFLQPGSFARALGVTQPDEVTADQKHGVEITLFGGEPLLEVSRPVVKHIVEESARRGFSVGAITNAVELDAYADLLGPGLISTLQVTIDGGPETHDRRRIGPNYSRTFDQITNNVDLALSRGVRVGIRINVDQANTEAADALHPYFRSRGWTENSNFFARAAIVHDAWEFGSGRGVVSGSQLVQITTQATDQTNNCIESYEDAARDALHHCLSGKHYPFHRASFCGAERGMMIFDPLGDVYACWEEIGHREERIGTYRADGLHLLQHAASKWLARFPGSIEECSACPYALIHTSGCARAAKRSSGTMFAPACESFQEYFPVTLAREYSRWEAALLHHNTVRA
jgi:uncharacterized protein